MKTSDLAKVAILLNDTLTNSGAMDDYDELLADLPDLDTMADYHNKVMLGLTFINEYSHYDNHNLDEWTKTYNTEVNLRTK